MATGTSLHTAADGMVISNPDILGGTPVFRGTRMPVKALFDYLADGLSLDYFVETFPSIDREQALVVMRYGWQRIQSELSG
ncbi:MAG TPA: DUF433 domain-containing protein [Candidatus Saccharimonadales bacterium]|nr:DUF433 domain-containing protein [Candidatus Saccharimonadales bacterium]